MATKRAPPPPPISWQPLTRVVGEDGAIAVLLLALLARVAAAARVDHAAHASAVADLEVGDLWTHLGHDAHNLVACVWGGVGCAVGCAPSPATTTTTTPPPTGDNGVGGVGGRPLVLDLVQVCRGVRAGEGGWEGGGARGTTPRTLPTPTAVADAAESDLDAHFLGAHRAAGEAEGRQVACERGLGGRGVGRPPAAAASTSPPPPTPTCRVARRKAQAVTLLAGLGLVRAFARVLGRQVGWRGGGEVGMR